MRKLKAYVHIKAPVQTVRDLATDSRREWMITHGGIWLKTLSESWEATEADGGTTFTLRVEYKAPLPILEDFMSDRFQESVTSSLDRLKQLAENDQLRH